MNRREMLGSSLAATLPVTFAEAVAGALLEEPVEKSSYPVATEDCFRLEGDIRYLKKEFLEKILSVVAFTETYNNGHKSWLRRERKIWLPEKLGIVVDEKLHWGIVKVFEHVMSSHESREFIHLFYHVSRIQETRHKPIIHIAQFIKVS